MGRSPPPPSTRPAPAHEGGAGLLGQEDTALHLAAPLIGAAEIGHLLPTELWPKDKFYGSITKNYRVSPLQVRLTIETSQHRRLHLVCVYALFPEAFQSEMSRGNKQQDGTYTGTTIVMLLTEITYATNICTPEFIALLTRPNLDRLEVDQLAELTGNRWGNADRAVAQPIFDRLLAYCLDVPAERWRSGLDSVGQCFSNLACNGRRFAEDGNLLVQQLHAHLASLSLGHGPLFDYCMALVFGQESDDSLGNSPAREWLLSKMKHSALPIGYFLVLTGRHALEEGDRELRALQFELAKVAGGDAAQGPLEGLDRFIQFCLSHVVPLTPYPEQLLQQIAQWIEDRHLIAALPHVDIELLEQVEQLLLAAGRGQAAKKRRKEFALGPVALPKFVWRKAEVPATLRRAALRYWKTHGAYLSHDEVAEYLPKVLQVESLLPSAKSLGWDPLDVFCRALGMLDWSLAERTAVSLAHDLLECLSSKPVADNVRAAVAAWLRNNPDWTQPALLVLRDVLSDERATPEQMERAVDESPHWYDPTVDEVFRKLQLLDPAMLAARMDNDDPLPREANDVDAWMLQGRLELVAQVIDRSRRALDRRIHARLIVVALSSLALNTNPLYDPEENKLIFGWCNEFAAVWEYLPLQLIASVLGALPQIVHRENGAYWIGSIRANSFVGDMEHLMRQFLLDWDRIGHEPWHEFHEFGMLCCRSDALFKLSNPGSDGFETSGVPTLRDLDCWIGFLPRNISHLFAHQFMLVVRAASFLQLLQLEQIRRLSSAALVLQDEDLALLAERKDLDDAMAHATRALHPLLLGRLKHAATEAELDCAVTALPWYQRLWQAHRIRRAKQGLRRLDLLHARQRALAAHLNRRRAAACLDQIRRFAHGANLVYTLHPDGVWLAAFGRLAGTNEVVITRDALESFTQRIMRSSLFPATAPVASKYFLYAPNGNLLQTLTPACQRIAPAWSAFLTYLVGEHGYGALERSGLCDKLNVGRLTELPACADELARLYDQALQVLNARARFVAQLCGGQARSFVDGDFPDAMTDLLCGAGELRFTQDVLAALRVNLPADNAPEHEWARAGLEDELAAALARLAECLIPAEHAVLSRRLDAWHRQWEGVASVEGITGLAAQWALLEQQRGLLLRLPHATPAQLRGELFDERQRARLERVFAPLSGAGRASADLRKSWLPLAAWLDEAGGSLGLLADAELSACQRRLQDSTYAHLMQFFFGRQEEVQVLVLSRDEAARHRLRQAWAVAIDGAHGVLEEGNLTRFVLGEASDIDGWLAAIRAPERELPRRIDAGFRMRANAQWVVRVRTFLEAAQPAAVVFCPELAALPWEAMLESGRVSRYAAVSHFGRAGSPDAAAETVGFDTSGARDIYADQAERQVIEELLAGSMRRIPVASAGRALAHAARRILATADEPREKMAVPLNAGGGETAGHDPCSIREAEIDPLTRMMLGRRIGARRWTHLVLHGRVEARRQEEDGGRSKRLAPSAAERALRGPSLDIAYAEAPEQPAAGSLSAHGDGQMPAWFLAGLRLHGTGLFLSSCEAALMLPARLREDGAALPDTLSWFGIAPAFAAAGAQMVVAPLWRVNQMANFLFVRAFYAQAIECPAVSVAQALAHAQHFVRTATAEQIVRWLELYEPDKGRRRVLLASCGLTHKSIGDARPLASPYYWAGYALLGDANAPLHTFLGQCAA